MEHPLMRSPRHLSFGIDPWAARLSNCRRRPSPLPPSLTKRGLHRWPVRPHLWLGAVLLAGVDPAGAAFCCGSDGPLGSTLSRGACSEKEAGAAAALLSGVLLPVGGRPGSGAAMLGREHWMGHPRESLGPAPLPPWPSQQPQAVAVRSSLRPLRLGSEAWFWAWLGRLFRHLAGVL